MRNVIILGSLLLASCVASTPPATQPAADPAPPAVAAAPLPPSGLDLDFFDRTVRPADDLYEFVAGAWLAKTQIPPDRSNYGQFHQLVDQAEKDMQEIVQELRARADLAAGSDERRFIDLYSSFMDTARIEQLGLTPLQGELRRIDAIRSRGDLAAYLGHAQPLGIDTPLRYFINVDARDPTHYVGSLQQSGLSLPDRDYYLKSDATFARYREALLTYARELLAAAGEKDAAGAARRLLAFETALARPQWTVVQERDALATYNRKTPAELAALAPQLQWSQFFAAAGAPADNIVVRQPSYLTALGRLLRDQPLADWRLYLRFRVLDTYASLLPARFDTLHFGFHERALEGVEQQRARHKRAVNLLDGLLGDIGGRLYVERRFTPQAKARIQQLVANLGAAFRVSFEESWMSPSTRAEARRKLDAMLMNVGYPDKWRDYGALTIVPEDLIGNVQRATRFEFEREIRRIAEPVDRSEWLMTTSTVNAYNAPGINAITFPAAILQPPFFQPDADDAVNYGAIGSVIGHEISHAFDDQGRQYDAGGHLRDWWTPEDARQFEQRAQRLVEQYGAYTVLDGLKLDGKLGLGENIADLAGVQIAYRAYMLSLHGRPAPVIDGFTGQQRFFLGWGQIWRRKYRDDTLRLHVTTDPHSPSLYRVNGVVINVDAFHEAFGTVAQDRLYRAPADRVRIW